MVHCTLKQVVRKHDERTGMGNIYTGIAEFLFKFNILGAGVENNSFGMKADDVIVV